MSTNTIIRVTSLNKSFGAVKALHDISLSIKRSEVVALIGDNGAGKFTIIKILAGVLRPDSGSLHIKGKELTLAMLQKSIGLNGVVVSADALFGTLSGGERQGQGND